MKLLHLILLCGLALAQPYFDLIGRNPEFLVAHRLGPWQIIALAVVLSLVLPAVLYLLTRVLQKLHKPLGSFVYGMLVLLFGILVLTPVFVQTLQWADLPAVSAAVFLALLFIAAYSKWDAVRQFMTVFGVVSLAFPIMFLFFTPVSGLLSTEPADSLGTQVKITKKPPVLFVVFDELPLVSMLDSNLELDAGRFPHFAELAQDAMFYRGHTTNADATLISIPAMLSGNMPFANGSGVPTYSFYPDNLFTLLGPHYPLHVQEHGTLLCPEQFCGEQISGNASIVQDSLVVLGQLLSPDFLAKKLPAINNDWLGFGESSGDQQSPATESTDLTINWSGRVENIEKFIAELSTDADRFHYLHAMVPHASWNHLPDGRVLSAHRVFTVLGMRPTTPEDRLKHNWYPSPALARISRQRHVLQSAYADTILGRLIEQLKQQRLYEESLIIVTSDHGAAFAPGESRRSVDKTNFIEVAAVPLLIKYPGSQPSGTTDRDSQHVDILPTLLAVLGGESSIALDGINLLDPAPLTPRAKGVLNDHADLREIPAQDYADALAQKVVQLTAEFGEGDFDSLIAAADTFDLFGKSLDEIEHTESNIEFNWKLPKLLAQSSPGSRVQHLVSHGVIEGPESANPSGLIAVTVNGKIAGINETFQIPDEPNSFQVLISPNAHTTAIDKIEAWFVVSDPDGHITLQQLLEKDRKAYTLTERGEQSFLSDGQQEFTLERGVVPGWVSTKKGSQEGLYVLAGWAADLAQKSPASDIVVFVEGEFYAAVSPRRAVQSITEQFDMPEVLLSGFDVPFLAPEDGDLKAIEVRVFALSPAGTASELNYSKTPKNWQFKNNPIPEGPAIKPYQ